MGASPFYALRELFNFAAATESQFLNLLELRLSFLTESTLEETQRLGHILKILRIHEVRIKDTLEIIRVRGSPSWPSPSSERKEKNDLIEPTTTSIFDDLNCLHQRILSLYNTCERLLTVLFNESMLCESRVAIEQAKQLQKLTSLAFFFIPLSFVSSLLGMNMTDLPVSTVRYWLSMLVLLLVVSCVFIVGNLREVNWRDMSAAYRRASFKLPWSRNGHHRAYGRKLQHDSITWTCVSALRFCSSGKQIGN